MVKKLIIALLFISSLCSAQSGMRSRSRNFDLKNQYGLFLDKVNEEITITNSVATLSATTTGTWNIWGSPVSATPADNSCLVTASHSTATTLIVIQETTTGKLRAACFNAGVGQWDITTASNQFVAGQMRMYTIVHNGTEPILYVNGATVSATFSTTTNKTVWFSGIPALNTMKIGGVDYGSVTLLNLWNGTLDECGIYNTALTAAQITELYNNGYPGNLKTHSARSNLKAWYRLGDLPDLFSTNWIINDVSGTVSPGASINMESTDLIQGAGILIK